MKNVVWNESLFGKKACYKLTKKALAVLLSGEMLFSLSSCGSKIDTSKDANLNVYSVSDSASISTATKTDNAKKNKESSEKEKKFEEIKNKYFNEKTEPLMLSFLELTNNDKRIMYLSKVNFEKTSFDVLNDFCEEVVNTLDINYFYLDSSVLKKISSLKIDKEKIKGISVLDSEGIDKFDFSIFPNLEYLDVNDMHIDNVSKLSKLESLLISSDNCERYDLELINLPENLKNLYLFNVDVDGAVLPSLYHVNLFFDEKFPYDVNLKSFNNDYLTVHSDKENVYISGQINKRLMLSDNCYVEELVGGCSPNVYKDGKVIDVSEVSTIENKIK